MSEGGHLGEHDFRSPLAEMPRVLLDWKRQVARNRVATRPTVALPGPVRSVSAFVESRRWSRWAAAGAGSIHRAPDDRSSVNR